MSKSMKKRNEWVTKKLKREKKLDDKGIADFAKVQRHFFKDLNVWISQMTDPRNGSYTRIPSRTWSGWAYSKMPAALRACGR